MRGFFPSLLLVPGCTPDRPPIDPGDVQPFAADPSAEVVESDPPPPPISGGTLTAARDGRTVVFADSDRDIVSLVDVVELRVVARAVLRAGEEPGRVVEDGSGRFHVVLRRAGAIATIRFGAHTEIERREVCAEPRGVAWDPAGDVVHVACTSGELVTLPAAGGQPTRRLVLDKDLRDVVVSGDRLVVTTFRGAKVLVVDRNGKVARESLPDRTAPLGPELGSFEAEVAWRAVPKPGGGALVVHQLGASRTLPKGTGGDFYYADVVRSGLVAVSEAGRLEIGPSFGGAALPVDVAICGDRFAVVAAGEPAVLVGGWPARTAPDLATSLERVDVRGEPVAVACGPDAEFVVASREPARIFALAGGQIDLGGPSREHTGHRMFHRAASSDIACASCHPEGRDDGHVWSFEGDGRRRTQPVGGGVLARAPFHWDGSLATFDDLVSEVFVARMGGVPPPRSVVDSMAHWLDSIPASKPGAIDAGRAAHGRAVYERAGCAGCHEGARDSFDVGTGGRFQAPDLGGVGTRAPYLHDGRARTLAERFGPFAGERHALLPSDVPDLVAYLEGL